MSGPIIFVATNLLKEGALELERTRVPELVDFVEREEPQVLAFNEYLNEAGDEVTVVQIHPDAILTALRKQASDGVEVTVNAERLGGFIR